MRFVVLLIIVWILVAFLACADMHRALHPPQSTVDNPSERTGPGAG